MSVDLVLFHDFSSKSDSPELPDGYWHMGTCLRSIVISDRPNRPDQLQSYKMYRNQEALEFLLQVICGLHSPLIGETEIFGQFKNFIKKNQEQFSDSIDQAMKSILKEAKAIRTQFLQNLGCTSYGSLLRKHITDGREPITILGAGSLVEDILPWFAKREGAISVLTRDPQKHQKLAEQYGRVSLQAMHELPQRVGGVLIIAAPVTREWLQQNSSIDQFSQVFDLRGEGVQDPIFGPNVRSLKELFSDIESHRQRASRVKGFAMQAIEKSATRIEHREKIRPFGWEDLWA